MQKNSTQQTTRRFVSRCPVGGMVALLLLAGCADRPAAPRRPSVSPDAAAADAIGQYDQDGDGLLAAAEISTSGALSAALKQFDTNGDDQLSKEEIGGGLKGVFGPSLSMTDVRCRVMLDGRPLPGATVRMIPEAYLGNTFPTAEGITDDYGTAIMVSTYPGSDEQIEAVASGLYRVEITSESTQLPPKYNSQSELGCVVSTVSQREGNSPTFELTSR